MLASVYSWECERTEVSVHGNRPTPRGGVSRVSMEYWLLGLHKPSIPNSWFEPVASLMREYSENVTLAYFAEDVLLMTRRCRGILVSCVARTL